MTKEKIEIPPLPTSNKLRQNIDAKKAAKKPVKNSSKALPIAMALLIFLIILGTGGFLYFKSLERPQQTDESSNNNLETSITMTVNNDNTSDPDQYPYIPKDWTYAQNDNCMLKIPVPPKKDPYIQKSQSESIFTEGTFWRDYFSSQKDERSESINAYFVEFSPEEVQPNIDHPARIVVFCKETRSIQTAETFFGEFYGSDLISVQATGDEEKWGKNLSVVKVEVNSQQPETYYYYSDTKRSAIITHRDVTEDQNRIQDQFVIDTLYTIYDNLVFID